MTTSYPALTVWQPWAWLIVNGYKDVENRRQGVGHKGTLLIHAGKTFDDEFPWDWAREILRRDYGAVMPRDPAAYPRGGIVGRATLLACLKRGERAPAGEGGWTPGRGFIDDSPWFFGPVGWALKDARPLAFQACRGQQGLFYPEVSLAHGGRLP